MPPLSLSDMAFLRSKRMLQYSCSLPVGEAAAEEESTQQPSPAMSGALDDAEAMLIVFSVANWMRHLGDKTVPISPALWGAGSLRSNIGRVRTLACAAVGTDNSNLLKVVEVLGPLLTERAWNEEETLTCRWAMALAVHKHLVDSQPESGITVRRQWVRELWACTGEVKKE